MSTGSAQSTSDGESTSREGPPAADAVPVSDSGEVGKALQNASPDDDLTTAAEQGSISAGEGGRAVDAPDSSTSRSTVEVIIGEIPDVHDFSVMRWTARCSDDEHDLLGTFDTEKEARDAKEQHLASQH
jgi:hypothetical protein